MKQSGSSGIIQNYLLKMTVLVHSQFTPGVGKMGSLKYVITLFSWILSYVSLGISIDGCRQPMGMGSGMITEDQLSASSHNDHVDRARLNGDRGWRGSSDSDEWIQVDFQRFVNIAGISIQGKHGGETAEYVTQFQVAYATEEEEWQYILDTNNEERVFIGNHNRNSPAYREFLHAVRLRFVRIELIECESRCALRFELYGCEATVHPIITTKAMIPVTTTKMTTRKTSTPKASTSSIRTYQTSRQTTSSYSSHARSTTITTPKVSNTKVAKASESVPSGDEIFTPRPPNKIITDVQSTTNISALAEAAYANAQKALSAGSIAGAVIGVLVILAMVIVAAICFFVRQSSSNSKEGKQVMQLVGPYEVTIPGEVVTSVTTEPLPNEQLSNGRRQNAPGTCQVTGDMHNGIRPLNKSDGKTNVAAVTKGTDPRGKAKAEKIVDAIYASVNKGNARKKQCNGDTNGAENDQNEDCDDDRLYAIED